MNREEDESENEKEDNESSYDAEAVELAHSEIRETFSRLHESHTELGKKGIKLIQLNALIVTILVSLLPSTEINPVFVFSGVLLLFSAFLSLMTYTNDTLVAGNPVENAERIVNNNLNKGEYLRWIIEKFYKPSLESNKEKINRRAKFIDWSIVLLTMAIVSLLGGLVYNLNVYFGIFLAALGFTSPPIVFYYLDNTST